MNERIVLVAFNGDPMCFAHVLLHALDMDDRGAEVGIVIEGTATQQVVSLDDTSKPFGRQYLEVRERGLIDCVCEACAAKTGALAAAKAQGLRLGNDMSGHPSLAPYIERGDRVITF